MKHFWENDGQPNDKGDYVAVVDLEDGSSQQRFEGKTEKEVADKLLEAQANATSTIRKQHKEITKNQKPEEAKSKAVQFQPKKLDANERFQVAQEVTDPEKAPEAIRRVVEAELGAPLEAIREQMNRGGEAEENRVAREEAMAFATGTPEFFPSEYNKRTLIRYMELHDYAPTRNNFAQAFQELLEAGLLQQKPTKEAGEESAQPEGGDKGEGGLPPKSNLRPRIVNSSTGIRNGDSAANGGGEPRTPKYTRQQIQAMSATEYKNKLDNEQGFREFVDKMA